jgi:uncharacterized membrane protein
MRHIAVTTACAAVLVTAVAGAGAERALVYTTIDAPGATTTIAQGINSRGDIVGGYTDSSGNHGYLLSKGVFTKIDYPGAAYTDANGLNARGEVVGGYRMPGEPALNIHGYLRTRHGEFVPVDFPGHINTRAQRITREGLILGCYHDSDQMASMVGIVINARNPSEFVEIDAFASMNNGSTPDGSLMVGFFTDMEKGRQRGYLLYGDTFIPFDVPGSTATAAWDVNGGGEVVGVYRDASNKQHGFLWEDLRFHSLDYTTATATRAFGINSRGDIVGSYTDQAGRIHGFVASRMREDHDDAR